MHSNSRAVPLELWELVLDVWSQCEQDFYITQYM